MGCNSIRWNDVCGYTTPRLVKIRDWRLGVLNVTLLLAIFIYVVVYNVVIQQRYRRQALDIVGSTRLQLKIPNPPYNIPAQNTSFCVGGTAPPIPTAYQPLLQYPCRYYDAYDAVDPGLEPGAIFISSRITETNQTLPDNCQYQPTYGCQYVNSGNSTTYYIGNVEMMTLLVDHTFSSASLGVSKSALTMPGQLIGQNGEVLNPCDDYASFYPAPCDPYVSIGATDRVVADIMPLKTLLRAAGINSLDEQAGSLVESHRTAGTVIVLTISYSNYYVTTGSFLQNYYTYTYTAAAVNDAEFKYEEVIPSPGSDQQSRRILDRHGIRILVKQAGDVGAWDVATLLISLTSSLGLLAVAATVVDFLATSILPLRWVYSQYKKVDSIDFEAHAFSQDEIDAFKKDDLVNPRPRFVRQIERVERQMSLNHGELPAATDVRQPLLGGDYAPPTGAGRTQYVTLPVGHSATGMYAPADTPTAAAAALYGQPQGEQRRGSGISLTTQQLRPLPPGPPPPNAVSREASTYGMAHDPLHTGPTYASIPVSPSVAAAAVAAGQPRPGPRTSRPQLPTVVSMRAEEDESDAE